MMENIFEIATRTKMRFPFKGQISVEDLWDLSVKDLDAIYKTLNAQAKKSQEESLLTTKTKEDETVSVQIEIVKYIVTTKLAEAEAVKKSIELKEKKQKIMKIMSAKQDEALHNMSVDELQKMLDSLNN